MLIYQHFKFYFRVLLFKCILRACGDEILVQVLDRVLQNSHGGTQVRKVGTAYKDEKDDEDTNKETTTTRRKSNEGGAPLSISI